MRTMVRPRRASSVPDAGGQVGQRRLGAGLAAQGLAGRLELAALAADAARPGVLAQRVDHGAPDAALGEGLELDAAAVVVAVRGVDEADHPVLHQVAEVDRVRHRRGHPAGNGFDEGQAGDDAILRGHGVDGWGWPWSSPAAGREGRSRAPQGGCALLYEQPWYQHGRVPACDAADQAPRNDDNLCIWWHLARCQRVKRCAEFHRLIRQVIDGLPTTGDGSLTADLRIRQCEDEGADEVAAPATRRGGEPRGPVRAYEPIRCRRARAVARASSTLATT